jgi:hypothetical protein
MGNLFTIFREIPGETVWEWREGPHYTEELAELPDFERATAYWVECGSERTFSALIDYLAAQLPWPAWVLDGAGTVWGAGEVDPCRLQL